MTTFPFIKATFPDADLNPRHMARRLVLHLLRLRADRAGVDLPECDDEALHDRACMASIKGVHIAREDHRRADRRANRVFDRILRESGLSHLDKGDRDRLSALKDQPEKPAVSGSSAASGAGPALVPAECWSSSWRG